MIKYGVFWVLSVNFYFELEIIDLLIKCHIKL